MHVVRGLDRDAARVERDPLSHQAEVVSLATTALVAEDDEARRLMAALRDREIAAHPKGAALVFVEDLDLDTRPLGQRTRLVGEDRRGHLVRGLVREAALKGRRLTDGL